MKTEVIAKLHTLDLKEIQIKIKGITPYLAEKMNPEIAEHYDKVKSLQHDRLKKKKESDTVKDKIHKTDDGKVGIPSVAFYKGMIECAVYMDEMSKKLVSGAVKFTEEIVPIKFSKETINVSIGRTQGMTKAPRKIMRPQFNDWKCILNIKYNASLISPEHIINLLNLSGFQMGVGGWRPQKSGTYGQYEVDAK